MSHVLGKFRLSATTSPPSPWKGAPDKVRDILAKTADKRSDAERNCLSNVRPEGLPPAEAARKLWWLAEAARMLQLTGVGLKDRSDERALPGVG